MATNFSPGAMLAGSDPLQVALAGDGFFILDGADGRTFTRDGNFQVDAQGQLVNARGDRVMGFAADEFYQLDTSELVPLQIPNTRLATSANGVTANLTGVAIHSDGSIRGRFSDGIDRDLGQLRVAQFANNHGLVAVADNRFQAGPNSGQPSEVSPGRSTGVTVVGSTIEQSNTDIVGNLLGISLATSQFVTSLAVFDTADELLFTLTSRRR